MVLKLKYMNWKKIMDSVLTILFILVIAYGAFFAIGREKVWQWIFGEADLGHIEFSEFTPSKKPNHALVCPDGFCKNAKTDKNAPIFEMPVDALKVKLLRIIDAEDNIVQVGQNFDTMQYRYVQRTSLMRFPDTIRVKFLQLSDDRSTVAIYSESQIGYRDLGVNFKRIERWMKQLNR